MGTAPRCNLAPSLSGSPAAPEGLELLTDHRAKPAVPYGGTHRLIDVALSCCSRGLTDVWVSQQHNPASISDRLADGRPGGRLTAEEG